MRVSHQLISGEAVRVPEGDLSADAKAAWRFLRDQGGYYSADELAQALMPLVDRRKGARTAGRWMFALSKRMHVAEHPRCITVKRYGVTNRCFPIPGESLEPADLPTPAEQA